MNLEITQNNLYQILPCKVSRVAEMLSDDTGCSIDKAMTIIYNSNLYSRLEDESTKLWHLGPVDLYRDLIQELNSGGLGGPK